MAFYGFGNISVLMAIFSFRRTYKYIVLSIVKSKGKEKKKKKNREVIEEGFSDKLSVLCLSTLKRKISVRDISFTNS